ncbi:MAG: hypothetical protein GXP30_03660 [Verrucomicrobia bacterium]|nr:hypothetical protein [Verrucomicrobiota bacterium]
MSSPDASNDDSHFNSLALEVFRFQYQHNQPYQQWCQHLGIDDPSGLTTWQEIPAVPTSAFKDSGLALNCFPPDSLNTIFKTSGTTSDQQRRGEHGFYSVDLYEHSILTAWQQLKLPENLPGLFLTQTAQDAPESSLTHMMEVISSVYPTTDLNPFFVSPSGDLDSSRFIHACQSLNQPVLILGTALAFLNLIEDKQASSPTLHLPLGSRLFETGGYKGSGRNLEKSTFYEDLSRNFFVSAKDIINEYSMTELSSQFYTHGLELPHIGPHWTRVQVIDPETRKAVSPEQTGHLQILDLANLGSVACIRTEDLAIATAAPASFHLVGRDPSALPRGCSR